MPWTRSSALADEHRARLIAAGVDPDVLASTALRLVTGPLPDWWHEQGNALYLGDDVDPADLPRKLIDTMTLYSFSDVLLVVASPCNNMASLLLGGDGATVFLGPRSAFTASEIYCGAYSTIVLNAEVIATRCAIIDARNGGSIVAETDQLWAANVYVATDDMHRLEDAETGARSTRTARTSASAATSGSGARRSSPATARSETAPWSAPGRCCAVRRCRPGRPSRGVRQG